MSRIFRTTLRLDTDKPASAQAAALLRRLHEERGLSYSALIIPAVNTYYGKAPADEHLRETIRSIVREELAAAFQQYAQVLENIEEQFETYNETGRLGDVHEPEIPWWRMLAEEEERRETEKNSQRIQDVK